MSPKRIWLIKAFTNNVVKRVKARTTCEHHNLKKWKDFTFEWYLTRAFHKFKAHLKEGILQYSSNPMGIHTQTIGISTLEKGLSIFDPREGKPNITNIYE